MEKFSFLKRIYYSIIGKEYTKMIRQTSWYAIFYLAILELVFTVIISVLVARQFLTASFIDVYQYVEGFLVDFFYNSVSLTFDTILVLSVGAYLYQLIKKDKKQYSKMFCLAAYSSTFAMIIKYIVFIYSYSQTQEVKYFHFIYVGMVLLYFVINYEKTIHEKS